MPGDAKFAAQFEEVVLYVDEAVPDVIRDRCDREYDTDDGVCFVNAADGFDSITVFGDTTAIAESGRAVISGARHNLAESITHSYLQRYFSSTKPLSSCIR